MNPEKIRQYAATAAGSVSTANQTAVRKAEREAGSRLESDRLINPLYSFPTDNAPFCRQIHALFCLGSTTFKRSAGVMGSMVEFCTRARTLS
jgi:hypothetical protein